MLPGVELARRRRVHYRGDAVGAGGGEHHGHHQQYQLGAAAQAVTGVVGPALAARIRLEEKLRGTTALPSSSHAPSRWGRQMRERDGRATSRQQNIQQEQQQQVLAASTELSLPCPPTTKTSCRPEMRRTLSKADLCAVCLDVVQERQQRVTQLPCSHKYHSDCVLPWLAIQPDCPCCRTLVPSVDSLS